MVPKNIMRLSDEQLITKVIDGNASFYELLFEKYKSKIYNFAYNIVKNKEDAKDISQDAFIKVYKALPRISGDLNFSAYLYKTTRNLSLDLIKQKKRFASPEPLDYKEDLDLNVSGQKRALLEEQQAQVRKAANDLPEDYAAVLALKELDNQSYAQISSIMQIPKNSVGVLLLRARLKFKEVFRMKQVNVEKLTKQCGDMLPLLSGHIDNELDDDERERLEKHLKDCPLCRLALEDMTEASKSYRAIIPLIIPVALKAEVFGEMSTLSKSSGLNELGSVKDSPRSTEAPTEILKPKTGQGSEAAKNTQKIDDSLKGKTAQKQETKESAEGGAEAITDTLKIKKSLPQRFSALSRKTKILLISSLLLLLAGSAISGVYAFKSLNKSQKKDQVEIEKSEPVKETKSKKSKTKEKSSSSSKNNDEKIKDDEEIIEEEIIEDEEEQENNPNEQPDENEQNDPGLTPENPQPSPEPDPETSDPEQSPDPLNPDSLSDNPSDPYEDSV